MLRLMNIIIVVLVLLSISPASAAIWYVSKEGSNDATGDSWNNAFQTIRYAIQVAKSQDSIWIKTGAYNEPLNINRPINLMGGFAGWEDSPDQRKPFDNPTRLTYQANPTWRSLIEISKHTELQFFVRIDGMEVVNQQAIKSSSVTGSILPPIIRAESPTAINGCVFSRNNTTVISLINSVGSVSNSIFADNVGTSVDSSNSRVRITNCIFYLEPLVAKISKDSQFYNNVVADCGLSLSTGSLIAPPLTGSNCFHSTPVSFGMPPGFEMLNGNFVGDPGLVVGEDGLPRITIQSPCLNAGDDRFDVAEFDIAGNPRTIGERVDIGPFEITSEQPEAILTVNGGTGSGTYIAPTQVQIEAGEAADGTVFDRWTGDIDVLSDPFSLSPLVYLSRDSTVNAAYRITGNMHVRPDGNDDNSGLSWESAKRTISAALRAVRSNEKVLVSSGEYSETPIILTDTEIIGSFDPATGQQTDEVTTIITRSGAETILTVGSKQANLNKIGVQGGWNGITASAGGSISLTDCEIRQARFNAIRAEGATVSMLRSMICQSGPVTLVRSISDIREATFVDGTGAGVSISDSPSGKISKSIFLRGNAGVICTGAESILIEDCRMSMTGNWGVYADNSKVDILRSRIIGGKKAGIESVSGSWLTVKRSEIAGAYIGINFTGAGTFQCINNTVVGCVVTGIKAVGGTIMNTISVYSPTNIEGGQQSSNITGGSELAGWMDQQFSPQPGAFDAKFVLPYKYGDFRLKSDSPAVDAAVSLAPVPDIAGASVPLGSGWDIGAREQVAVRPSPQQPPVVVENPPVRILRVQADTQAEIADGATWETAYPSLADAMLDAWSNGGCEIWVARGQYPESLTVAPFTHVFGAFDGTENELISRKASTERTTFVPDGQSSTSATLAPLSSVNNLYFRGLTEGVDILGTTAEVSNSIIETKYNAIIAERSHAAILNCTMAGVRDRWGVLTTYSHLVLNSQLLYVNNALYQVNPNTNSSGITGLASNNAANLLHPSILGSPYLIYTKEFQLPDINGWMTYRLLSGSELIDRGINTYLLPWQKDAYGSARRVNNRLDIGACEHTVAPVAPTITDQGAYTLDNSQLKFSFSSALPEQVVGFVARVIRGGGNYPSYVVADWQLLDTQNLVITGLSLQSGINYIIEGYMVFNEGEISEPGRSDGITYTQQVQTIVDLLRLPSSVEAFVEGWQMTTSNISTSLAYIQQPNRAAGIAVKSNTKMQAGDVITGIFRRESPTSNTYWIDVVNLTPGETPPPLNTSIASLVTDKDGNGASDSGVAIHALRIKTAGRVLRVMSANVFYMDDGSGLNDGNSGVSGEVTGLRVYCRFTHRMTAGDFVTITGNMNREKITAASETVVNGRTYHTGDTYYRAFLDVGASSDIVKVIPDE